jgi:acetoacetate decarboxylase
MATVRYGARPVVQQVDHEVEATQRPVVTEALTIIYETDPEIIAAVLPPPLEPPAEPLVRVVMSTVAIRGGKPFGSGNFTVKARHEGTDGEYCLFMPMSTEQVVVGGRETFGEPKKIAQVTAVRNGDEITASISRMGFTLFSFQGRAVEKLEAPVSYIDLEFYFKYLRSPDGNGLTDPHLVYCTYDRVASSMDRVDGELTLGESPVDPVADIVVRRIRSITWQERVGRQTAFIKQRVSSDDLMPYVHQKYDDMAAYYAAMSVRA